MRCENEPAAGLAVLLDDILDGLNIISALFQEISRQLIEINLSDVDALAAAAAGYEIFGGPGFNSWPGHLNRVGERLEIITGEEPMKG